MSGLGLVPTGLPLSCRLQPAAECPGLRHCHCADEIVKINIKKHGVVQADEDIGRK